MSVKRRRDLYPNDHGEGVPPFGRTRSPQSPRPGVPTEVGTGPLTLEGKTKSLKCVHEDVDTELSDLNTRTRFVGPVKGRVGYKRIRPLEPLHKREGDRKEITEKVQDKKRRSSF